MTLSGLFSSATSGLQAAQAQLRAVSDNVANVDTPGYVRKTVDQSAPSDGVGGVSVGAVARAADRFLQAAGLKAASDAGSAGATAGALDQAQQLFGDPSSATSLFGALNGAFTAFTGLSSEPTTAGKAQAVGAVSQFFDQAAGVSQGLQGLSAQTDGTLSADVATVNGLLSQIDGLSGAIATAQASGGDASDVENRQSGLIDTLATLIDVKVAQRSGGGVDLRTADGTALAGNGAATLAYDGSGPTGTLTLTPAGGQPRDLSPVLQGGAIRGLLSVRNTELPAVQAQLSTLTRAVADQLNAAHNADSPTPAPATLTGKDTGLDLPTVVGGFTGVTHIAVVDASGKLVRRADVDFDAGTITTDTGATTSFTPRSFLQSLNGALSPAGSASFANGALTLSATGGAGVAVADDVVRPASRAGQGFSAAFGLNDLVTGGPTSFATGLKANDPSGFSGAVTLRLTASDGTAIRDLNVTAPAGGTVGDLVTALNAPAGGVGLYGAFALDAQGRLAFTPAQGSGVTLSVPQDATQRGTGGPSVSALFGIGDAARAASTFAVRSDIAASPGKLALARLDPTAATGASALAPGDAQGADALSQAGQAAARFDPGDPLAGAGASVTDYASAVAAAVGRRASDADAAQTGAQAVAAQAVARRSSGEGVNLDDELVKLTTYQQAYSASARLIQSARDVYDTLLSIVQ